MLLRSLKFKLKLLVNYFEILNKHYKSVRPFFKDKSKKVYFDLHEKNAGRYFYALIFFFYKEGYGIYLKNNFSFIASCVGDGQRIFSIPELYIVDSLSPDPDVVYVTDRPKGKNGISRWKKYLLINFDVYDYTEKENHVWLPYPMSPSNYKVENQKLIQDLRVMERKKGIFFSGNTDKGAYTNPIIKSFFNKVNRFEVIETIKENLSVDELIFLNQANPLKVGEDLSRKFVLADWQWSPQSSHNLNSRVGNDNWLESLAESNFFLACPGVTMPMCHNIVEAMSVGTIPITEYPEYFHSPLVHQKNCIVYKGKEDLILKIKEVLRLEQGEIKILRGNVISYYDRHLSSRSFIEKIESIESRDNILYMNGENVSLISHSKNPLQLSA